MAENPDHQFWYNLRTHEVEEGMQSSSFDRAGPFASRAEAERAPDIMRERADKWAEEDAEEAE